MNKIWCAGVWLLTFSFFAFPARSSSILPMTTDRKIELSSAIFRGVVVSVESYQDPADGGIYTRTALRVEEVFKGKLPALVKVIHRGGVVGGRGEIDGFSPQFKVGDERLLFVSRRADGTLYATLGEASALKLASISSNASEPAFVAGHTLLEQLRQWTISGQISGSDVTDQAASPLPSAAKNTPNAPIPLINPMSTATNLLVDANGIPARFVLPDRGEQIPYLIDADYLPAGITLTQAVNAVQAALRAWTNVTSLKYTFAGIQSFGMAAPNIQNGDGMLRIQLHDHYNFIGGGGNGSGDILGQGGHAWITTTLSNGWTTGGNVIGNDFHRVINGYIVLQHTNTFMQNITNFSEVLCHEIGHTIGLAHSSQNPSEPNPILNQAIMYYAAHGNGRGATISNFDIAVSRQMHPPNNTPPYNYDRVMDIVTSPTPPLNVPGANMVQVRGYDLQTTNLAFATTGATAMNGTFSNVNSNLTYVPSAFWSDSGRLDPAGNAYYDLIFARYSDGTNASPFATIRVISFNADTYSEGIPDTWRNTYFGSPNPNAGPRRHATDDFDGDGYNNLEEYRLGSNPTDKTSNLSITSFAATNLQWQAKGYEVYELYGSTNLTNWARALNPMVPTNSIGATTGYTNGGPKQFFRVQKVP